MVKSIEIIEFEWDKGNINKNLKLHNVSDEECEEIFFDPHKKVLKDALHSTNEERHILIGKTKLERPLFLIFTVRKNKIRVISSRNLNKKEKHLYEQKT